MEVVCIVYLISLLICVIRTLVDANYDVIDNRMCVAFMPIVNTITSLNILYRLCKYLFKYSISEIKAIEW